MQRADPWHKKWRSHQNMRDLPSFFKTLKQEEIYRKDYRSEKDMLRSITIFMEFYNNSRPHSMNGYRTPNKHEAAYYKRKAVQNLEQLDSYI